MNPENPILVGVLTLGWFVTVHHVILQYKLAHVCVGDLLRAEVADGTEAGLKAKMFMDNGDLVPNEVVVDMVKNALSKAEKGWLLDGYPRSLDQAQAIEKENIRPDIFLLLEVCKGFVEAFPGESQCTRDQYVCCCKALLQPRVFYLAVNKRIYPF